jgi:dGTPase
MDGRAASLCPNRSLQYNRIVMICGSATHSSLEAQVAAIADDIAYNTHDIDDGLRSGLITIGDA